MEKSEEPKIINHEKDPLFHMLKKMVNGYCMARNAIQMVIDPRFTRQSQSSRDLEIVLFNIVHISAEINEKLQNAGRRSWWMDLGVRIANSEERHIQAEHNRKMRLERDAINIWMDAKLKEYRGAAAMFKGDAQEIMLELMATLEEQRANWEAKIFLKIGTAMSAELKGEEPNIGEKLRAIHQIAVKEQNDLIILNFELAFITIELARRTSEALGLETSTEHGRSENMEKKRAIMARLNELAQEGYKIRTLIRDMEARERDEDETTELD